MGQFCMGHTIFADRPFFGSKVMQKQWRLPFLKNIDDKNIE
jgi:hypothetical protein